ncbi:hypothetical protein [Streptomyces sp. NPDC008150]|uniref:hypothetical protein n=1 Tax=Streptomyces sp. NPDC008150 TaxID=3364816 RepID=UPI0036E365E7
MDTSGRRAKLLRRLGLLLGAVCLGYAGVLGLAFMGWGTSLTPSSLLPFADGAGGGAAGPDAGRGPGGALPSTGSRASAAPGTSAAAR